MVHDVSESRGSCRARSRSVNPNFFLLLLLKLANDAEEKKETD
jgi:hypothetical protein